MVQSRLLLNDDKCECMINVYLPIIFFNFVIVVIGEISFCLTVDEKFVESHAVQEHRSGIQTHNLSLDHAPKRIIRLKYYLLLRLVISAEIHEWTTSSSTLEGELLLFLSILSLEAIFGVSEDLFKGPRSPRKHHILLI
jgi:hypothetical protein